ncbi:unnamed protein product [Taenia asiatica]|uniref:Uncharacterized protein n=1 Tax=Taenia asiatica TaxID=60517 RepID=A0A3P6P3B7_TAEAS|nr:unnamed protein product [Taenia asiatica]
MNDPLSGVTVARIRMLPNTMAVPLTKKAEKTVASKKQTYCLTSEAATVNKKQLSPGPLQTGLVIS